MYDSASNTTMIHQISFVCLVVMTGLLVFPQIKRSYVPSAGSISNVLLSRNNHDAHPDDDGDNVDTIFDQNDKDLLVTTLYVEKCTGDNFIVYTSPINECYNGKSVAYHSSDAVTNLKPKSNNPYGDHDIMDGFVKEGEEFVGIARLFFQSKNGTCLGGVTDSFPNIPLNECVGPFGPPYPWGILKITSSSPHNENSKSKEYLIKLK